MDTTLTLSIEGMTCASCVARVEKALKTVPGVESAEVNLATERATVHAANATGAAATALIAAVVRAGYHVTTAAAGTRTRGLGRTACRHRQHGFAGGARHLGSLWPVGLSVALRAGGDAAFVF